MNIDKFTKPFDSKSIEADMYKRWEDSGYFNPDTLIRKGIISHDAQSFSLVMPPPNVTGVLHMGHALGLTLQDIMTRFYRMNGYKALWIPGTDHAAIATQAKVEKEIEKKEGLRRHDLGREELLKRVNEYARNSHDVIVNQTRVMGASCDWSRECYTLDEKRNIAVNTVFEMMHNDGVMYQGDRVVNWDPKGGTTISDDEIVKEERKGVLYTFRYWNDFPIEISTTRPETKFGDVAVAVHPDDIRYTHLVGKTFTGDFLGTELSIKIIADRSVEKDFGTGALGVTPAHSYIDWQIGNTHELPLIQVINEHGKMIKGPQGVIGEKTEKARVKVVELLKEAGLVSDSKEAIQQIPTAERTGAVIEPLPKLQWFIDVNKKFALKGDGINGMKRGDMVTLKDLMRQVVHSGQISIIPDFESKKYFHWIDNLQDWCVSRQIWFGHRIPVWYRKNGDQNETFCGVSAPEGEGWTQDEDTLDTWFSSGLWTFSTLGWPEITDDFKTYHPTAVIETAYEILFFWVARMILMSTYTLGQIPFKTIYLHGLLRDKDGRKLSKSLGNGGDPMESVAEYGCDGLRMALVVGAAPGLDSKLSPDKIKAYKHFANKLWNIARFVLTNVGDVSYKSNFDNFNETDLHLIKEVLGVKEEVTREMFEYKFHIASEKLYGYMWRRFADEILEDSKLILKEGSEFDGLSRKQALLHILVTNLKMLHPFMPYITEEIWGTLFPEQDFLMVEKW